MCGQDAVWVAQMAERRLWAEHSWAAVSGKTAALMTLGNNSDGLMALRLFFLHRNHFLSRLYNLLYN